jgi:hypothetical protein
MNTTILKEVLYEMTFGLFSLGIFDLACMAAFVVYLHATNQITI